VEKIFGNRSFAMLGFCEQRRKGQLKRTSTFAFMLGFLAASLGQGFGQTNLHFIKIAQTDEQAIRLTWTSVSNETYEVDEADQLVSTNGGPTVWNQLYTEYPSQGTNTFWLDTGNYTAVPVIVHPKYSPMRFYRIVDSGPDTTTDEPIVSVTLPTNGTVVSGELTINVLAGTDQPVLSGTELYVDGQEMQMADSTSNYTAGSTNYESDVYSINTCEWGNGTHTLFATTRCASEPEGAHNVPAALIGHAVSAFVPVVFSNLVTRISFSQYFFDPTTGQTQQVSAVFAANSDWTLNITDASSNTVRTATGSGTSMLFNWDGTGTGETNLPAGIYYYYITAQTNGLAPQGLIGGSGLSPASPSVSTSGQASELWTMPADGSGSAVPFILYPPGAVGSNMITFEAPATWNPDPGASLSDTGSAAGISDGGDAIVPDFSSPQSTPPAPQRPPNNPVRGVSGTFGVAYQTYSANGSSGYRPAFPDDGSGSGTKVLMENYGANNPITYPPLKESKTMANNFIKWMKHGGWNPTFDKIDDAQTISDLRGSGTSFNTVNFGMLMTHGTYGTTPDYTPPANGCMQMYFPITAGGSAQYLRMSEMNFGSSGTNGLKWMTLWACFSLQTANWQNMQTAGVQPYNSNLHLLLGADTLIYTDSHLLGYWAKFMTVGQTANSPMTIRAAWYTAARKAYAGEGYSAPIIMAVAGDDACQNDSLQNNTSPSGTPYYDSNQVYP
jgi:hypothetical protein